LYAGIQPEIALPAISAYIRVRAKIEPNSDDFASIVTHDTNLFLNWCISSLIVAV